MNMIIVKDYIYDGNYILGFFEETKDGEDHYLLDDGDIYTIKVLKEEWGYSVAEITSDEVIEKFKERFK